MDENTEVEEATESNEENSEQEDTASNEELEKLRKANSDLLISRKKAEAEVKKLKSEKAEPPINNSPQLSEELKLIARGLSDE